MGTIQGRVTTKESGSGIPDLVVTLFGSGDEGNTNLLAPNVRAIRLGSVVTDDSGTFKLEYTTPEDAAEPNLRVALTVSPPEGPEGATEPLFQAPARRVRAEGLETFLVRIPTATLAAAGIDPPEAPTGARAALNFATHAAAELTRLNTGWQAAAATRVDEERVIQQDFQRTFLPRFLDEIRTLPIDVARPDRLVSPGDSVRALNTTAISDGVTAINASTQTPDGARRRTRFFLSDEQRARLDQLIASNITELTEEQLQTVLRAGELDDDVPKPRFLLREEAFLKDFLERTFEERCSEEILGLGPATEDTPSTGGDGGVTPTGEPLTREAILEQAHRVTADVNAPLSALARRPGQEDIVGNIRDFALDPGPADSPALFDFHSLRIAFDHIWQEVLDERIEPLVRHGYTTTRRLGGNPDHESHTGKRALRALADEVDLVEGTGLGRPPNVLFARPRDEDNDAGEFDGVLDSDDDPRPGPFGGEFVDDSRRRPETPKDLLTQLKEILRGPYAFSAFGSDAKSRAVNFGLVVTYRQKWDPVTYQVGELAKTITLAPGESRKYTRSTRVNRKRAEKEVEKNSSVRRDELNQTTRAETDIVRKANAKTNFNLTAEGTYNFGIASGDATTTAGHDAERASDETKKSYRESVIKAAQEYKQERSVEVSTEDTIEFHEEESGEISNPNDELPVTYLFYELQRRFRITEQIHQVRPVVLVAQPVPAPNHIDQAFLVEHDWIIKRALLDDSFEPALEYLATRLVGDKLALDVLRKNMSEHRTLVNKLGLDLSSMNEQAGRRYEALERAVSRRINESAAEEGDSFFSDLGQALGIGSGQTPEAAQAREDAARDAEQRAVERAKELAMRLQREVTALNEATEKYTRALREHKNHLVQIARLQVHVKQNILHYMQAIWSHEMPDQRFLRLYQTPAPEFIDEGTRYRFLGEVDLDHVVVNGDNQVESRRAVEFEILPNVRVSFANRTLAELADVDSLLGFKGNYMIFPLKESNALTDFMLNPYVDAGFRLLDPHEPGNISRQAFARYICHLRDTLSEAAFDNLRPELRARFRELLLSPAVAGDEIIVPTGSLYIEALPGANPLLEDFKLAHRAMDVLKAQEETREATLDNLRLSARLVEGDLADPDIEKSILIQGATSGLSLPVDDE